MKTILKPLFAILLCVAILAPTGTAFATGYESTGGTAYTSIYFHTYPRYISNPASPGPEAAFYQTSGNPGLYLGKHNCDKTGGGPMYKQSIGSWQPVAYTLTPMTFCLFSYSSSNVGPFAGDINWD